MSRRDKAPRVSDHALLRFLERAGSLDVEGLRASLSQSLSRAHTAARQVSRADYLIRIDGLVYVVRGEVVATVIEDTTAHSHAMVLDNAPRNG